MSVSVCRKNVLINSKNSTTNKVQMRYRSNHRRCSVKKSVLKYFANFT